jgi:hypothetical protein
MRVAQIVDDDLWSRFLGGPKSRKKRHAMQSMRV